MIAPLSDAATSSGDASEAASDAWSLVFDSSVGFDDKAMHLEDADSLRGTVEAYTVAGDAMGLGAGVAMGQVLAQNLQAGLAGGAAPAAPAAPVGVRPDEVMATLEKLAELKAKGILTQEEFDAKKAELLKKLV